MKRFTVTAFVICFAALMIGENVHAQSKMGFMGIGGGLSFVKPEDTDSSIGFGVHADLGELATGLHLYPSIEYFKNTNSQQTFFGNVEAEASVTSLNGDLRYYFPTESKAAFYGGGGVAVHLTGATKVDGQEVADSQTDFGVNLLGGVDVPVSPNINLNGQAKFILSDNNGFKITGGLTYLLGK